MIPDMKIIPCFGKYHRPNHAEYCGVDIDPIRDNQTIIDGRYALFKLWERINDTLHVAYVARHSSDGGLSHLGMIFQAQHEIPGLFPLVNDDPNLDSIPLEHAVPRQTHHEEPIWMAYHETDSERLQLALVEGGGYIKADREPGQDYPLITFDRQSTTITPFPSEDGPSLQHYTHILASGPIMEYLEGKGHSPQVEIDGYRLDHERLQLLQWFLVQTDLFRRSAECRDIDYWVNEATMSDMEQALERMRKNPHCLDLLPIVEYDPNVKWFWHS